MDPLARDDGVQVRKTTGGKGHAQRQAGIRQTKQTKNRQKSKVEKTNLCRRQSGKTALGSFHMGATKSIWERKTKWGTGKRDTGKPIRSLEKTGSKTNRTQINKIKQEIIRNMDPDTELFSLVH